MCTCGGQGTCSYCLLREFGDSENVLETGDILFADGGSVFSDTGNILNQPNNIDPLPNFMGEGVADYILPPDEQHNK